MKKSKGAFIALATLIVVFGSLIYIVDHSSDSVAYTIGAVFAFLFIGSWLWLSGIIPELINKINDLFK